MLKIPKKNGAAFSMCLLQYHERSHASVFDPTDMRPSVTTDTRWTLLLPSHVPSRRAAAAVLLRLPANPPTQPSSQFGDHLSSAAQGLHPRKEQLRGRGHVSCRSRGWGDDAVCHRDAPLAGEPFTWRFRPAPRYACATIHEANLFDALPLPFRSQISTLFCGICA